MHTFNKIVLAILMLINIPDSNAQLNLASDPLYVLKFSDNFDTAGLRTNKWNTGWAWWGVNGANSNIYAPWCGSNFPASYCRRNPVTDTVNWKYFPSGSPNHIRLRSKAENFNANVTVWPNCPSSICTNHSRPCDPWDLTHCTVQDSVLPFKLSNAVMQSKNSFTNGYFEIRYRLPNIAASTNNAYTPTFWMWGGGGPCSDSIAYTELDIYEMDGRTWKMAPNIHYKQWNTPGTACNSTIVPADTVYWHAVSSTPNTYAPYDTAMFPAGSGGYNGGTWHTVGCEWTPEYIDFYYDTNDTVRRFSNSVLPIIDNLAKMQLIVGTGVPADNYCIWDTPSTQWPFDYDIDYVKVYQLNQVSNCSSTSGTFSSFTTNSYTSTLYRDLTIGGGGTAIVNSGNYHFAGQNFVLLESGFEVSGTATATISTKKCQSKQSMQLAAAPDATEYQKIISNMKIARQNNNISND
jgi:hypothetical protein